MHCHRNALKRPEAVAAALRLIARADALELR
jgi:hypothetical protein